MGSNSRKKKKVDQYGFTVHAKEESEENLSKEDSSNGEDHSKLENHRDEMEGEHGGHDSGIMQTRSVTVAYDQVSESGGGTTAATRWAAV